MRWEEETGESLEAYGPVILAYLGKFQAMRDSVSSKRRTNIQDFDLHTHTHTHTHTHHHTPSHTHTHTHTPSHTHSTCTMPTCVHT
jgi:isoleucyl-tRNA synthetase